MIKTGSMYVQNSATATAVFKQFCLYWLSYTCTTGTLTTHNSVILVATATTQSADCNCYQFLPHMKNVLWLFILVLHACANSSIMFHWTQISFWNYRVLHTVAKQDFRCDGSEEKFWQYKEKCHIYVNIVRSVSTTLH